MGLMLKKYIWVLSLLCTVFISYLLAKMTSLFIEGQFPSTVITVTSDDTKKGQQTKRRAQLFDIDVILKRNFFDAKDTASDAAIPATEEPKEEPKPQVVNNAEAVLTSLNISLVSTISVGDGKNPRSSCVIKSGRKEDTYTIVSKESFAPNTKVVQILPKKVIFTNQGRLEYVLLEDFAKTVDLNRKPTRAKKDRGAKRVSRSESKPEGVVKEGDSFQISRSLVDKALANLEKLYTDVRAVPYFKDGKANGFKLLSVKRGSLFDKLGLRRGDILKTINGTTLDIQSGLQTFNALKNETSFSLDLERRSQEKTFQYQIVE